MIKHLTLIVLMSLFIPTAWAGVEFEKENLEAWADRTFGEAFEHRQFSGLVVTLVQDGEIKLSRGYGYADYEAKTPVDPAITGFMIASITKTFTATAIAQLVDNGLIDNLDDPANKYLKRMKIPVSFGRQITLWDLLTHRAGYEDYLTHTGSLGPDIQVPLDESIIAAMTPEIVREPGSLSIYSNFSTSVLGLLIEDVTGVTLDNYFKQNIFDPLSMAHTELTYYSARPEEVGVPYAFFPNGDSQRIPQVPFHPLIAPAGGIVSTADDMARYMMAHLAGGRNEGKGILSPEMFDQMHTRHAGNHDDTSGLGMKFMVRSIVNQTIFLHPGNWPGWWTMIVMMPEINAGYFIAVMAGPARPSLWEKMLGGKRLHATTDVRVGEAFEMNDLIAPFAARYFGPPWQIDTFATSDIMQELPGIYWRSKRSYTRMDALFELLRADDTTIRVESDGAGSVTLDGRGPFKPISNSTFGLAIDMGERGAGRPIFIVDKITFTQDAENGVITMLPNDGVSAYDKAGAIKNPRFMLQLLSFSVLVGLTGLFTVLWRDTARVGRYGKWFAVSLSVSLLLAFCTIFVGFGEGEGWHWYQISGQTARFLALAVLGNLIFLFSFGIGAIAALSWISNCFGSGRSATLKRVYYSLLAFAGLGLILVLDFVNMIGFHLPV